MKNVTKVLCIVMALCLLAGCGLVEVDDTKVVVANVDGEKIMKADYEAKMVEELSSYGYTLDSLDAETLKEFKLDYLEQMINEIVIQKKIVELGYDQISEEDRAAELEYAQSWFDEQKKYLVENVTKDEADPEAAADEYLQDYMANYGFDSIEQMVDSTLESKPRNDLYYAMTDDVEVTDEYVREIFDTKAAQSEDIYAEDLATWLQDYSNGMNMYYTPEGLFFIKHILISLPSEIQTEIKNLRTEDKDADADVLRAAEAEKLKAKTDEIQARIDAGEDFDALVLEYNEDVALNNYPDGYLTYKNAGQYVPEFEEAVSKLEKEGDMSEFIVTDYGVHIIRRYADKPAGVAEFESLEGVVRSQLLSGEKDARYEELLEEWKAALKIERFEDRL